MSIKIIRGTDPIVIETTVTLIYGDPGSGKSTLAFTSNEPLLLDFDAGAHRSGFRGDSVPIKAWDDVTGLSESDLGPYSTLIVDTVGRCLDLMSLDIINQNPKLGTSAGGLTLQGYGALKSGFAAWMRKIRSYGLDVVLIAHGDEKTSGDVTVLRPEITGGSYAEVFKQADGVGYLRMVNQSRMLAWDPSERFVGKNPAGLEPVEVPHVATNPRFMAGVLQRIKDAMGQLSEESRAVIEEVGEWQVSVEEAGDNPKGLTTLVESVNERAPEMHEASVQQVKALIARAARENGFKWDGKAKAFKAEAAA